MSPPTSQSTRRRANAPARRGRPSRRGEIFAAALRLFRERGFHATSINDIGEAAGVAGTAVYAHFPTKQEVLTEAIREGAGRIAAGMQAALSDTGQSPEQALESLVRAYVKVVLENADMNACYVLESRTLTPDVAEPMKRKTRALRDAWCDRLLAARPELDREQARAMVQMAIFSTVALCVHHNRIDHDTLVEQATHFVLGALWSPVPTRVAASERP